MAAGRSASWAVAALLAWTSLAGAVQPDEILPDARLEGRARAISAGLRCVVCQNQSIDDSDAPLAHDLRVLVRTRLQAGDTDAQVSDYVSGRYGEFVLLKPILGWHTVALWLAPVLVLLGASLGLFLTRRRGRPRAALPLTTEEEAEIRSMIGDAEAGGLRRP